MLFGADPGSRIALLHGMRTRVEAEVAHLMQHAAVVARPQAVDHAIGRLEAEPVHAGQSDGPRRSRRSSSGPTSRGIPLLRRAGVAPAAARRRDRGCGGGAGGGGAAAARLPRRHTAWPFKTAGGGLGQRTLVGADESERDGSARRNRGVPRHARRRARGARARQGHVPRSSGSSPRGRTADSSSEAPRSRCS